MKKIIFTALLALLSVTDASAQLLLWDSSKPEQPYGYGLRAGMNISNLHYSYEGIGMNFDSRQGFRVGLSAEYGIVKSFYINTGLYLSIKGADMKDMAVDEHDRILDVSVVAGYLEIPIQASYRINLPKESQIQVNFGPYFSCGAVGQTKIGRDTESTFSKDVLRRFDVGFGTGVGYTFRHVYLGFEYQFGLPSVMDMEGFGKIVNRNIAITLGYNF